MKVFVADTQKDLIPKSGHQSGSDVCPSIIISQVFKPEQEHLLWWAGDSRPCFRSLDGRARSGLLAGCPSPSRWTTLCRQYAL